MLKQSALVTLSLACVTPAFAQQSAHVHGIAELNLEKFTHSPITGVHLWFDRPITELPHASLPSSGH